MNNIFYIIVLISLIAAVQARADRIVWLDDSVDSNGPPGKLLSDNEGYYGECVMTGVDYAYQTAPTAPQDRFKDDSSKFGRRLLDGYYSGNWYSPVGINGEPLVVIFDFKRLCVFNEIDLITRSKRVDVKIEASKDEKEWAEIGSLTAEDCADSTLQRIKIAGKPSGRYVRLTVDAGATTYLEQVIAWGDADSSDSAPEYLKPTVEQPIVNGIALESIPGKAETACTDVEFFKWTKSIGKMANWRAVWSEMETWGSLSDKPILPKEAQINKTIEITMARNESECVAVSLTNTSINNPSQLQVELSEFTSIGGTEGANGVAGELRVGGAIPSRWYGVGIGPLFSQDNMLGKTYMRNYLTNGAGIMDFPNVTLSPAGSAVFWIKVTSDMAKPGTYEARLSYKGGPSKLVRVKVLDVTLPDVDVWLQSWSGTTSMFPFVYEDRMQREVDYKVSLGVSVWGGWPDPGTAGDLARKEGKAYYQIWGIGNYGHTVYNSGIKASEITPEIEAEVAQIIRGHVAKAKELGLDYDEWYVELTDEPGLRNAEVYGAFSRIIKKTDPNVNIYCNPSFWAGFENDAVAPDDKAYDALAPWYNECVDVSCPFILNVELRPKSFEIYNKKALINAFYNVSSHHAKCERRDVVEEYRKFAWKAHSLGWNGWGFYSYFAPRGNPWTDFDASFPYVEDLPDYQIVYPGPRGPVPTRHSESVREGWEDYKLLTLLQENKPQLYEQIIKDYRSGKLVEELRITALEALSKK